MVLHKEIPHQNIYKYKINYLTQFSLETSGTKGGGNYFFSNLFQSKSLNHGCSLISYNPLTPNLLLGSLFVIAIIKSLA